MKTGLLITAPAVFVCPAQVFALFPPRRRRREGRRLLRAVSGVFRAVSAAALVRGHRRFAAASRSWSGPSVPRSARRRRFFCEIAKSRIFRETTGGGWLISRLAKLRQNIFCEILPLGFGRSVTIPRIRWSRRRPLMNMIASLKAPLAGLPPAKLAALATAAVAVLGSLPPVATRSRAPMAL